MRNRSLPSFKSTEHSTDLQRKVGSKQKGVPTIVLIMIGIYVAFLGYYLVIEDVLELAPTADNTATDISVPSEPVGQNTATFLP